MQRISICAMKKDRKAILEELQELGVLEVETSIVEGENLETIDKLKEKQLFEKNASLAEQALDVLEEYEPEKKSMFASLAGKALLEQETHQQMAEQKDHLFDVTKQILARKKEIAENLGAIAKLETQKEALTPWLALDVPMNYEGTKSTATFIGSIGKQMTLEEIYMGVASQSGDLDAMDIQIIEVEQDQTYLVATCIREKAGELEEGLRALGFARPTQVVREVPSKVKANIEVEIGECDSRISVAKEAICQYAAERNGLRWFSDYYRVRAQKYEVLGRIPHSKQTFFISGYVTKKDSPALEEKLSKHYDLAIDIEEIPEEEEMPILLKNGKMGGAVEGVVASYGLPQRHEVDPSSIMSIFYFIFFGLMLSDAAYGFIIFVACALVLKKFPRMEESLRKSIRMFMFCGLSTLIWGILFGGYFGDALNIISKTFFGHEIGIAPVWFAPLDDPMKLLMFSMLFGVIHLFVGLGLKGYMCLKAKKYLDFFCDVVLWYIMLIGLILMLLPTDMFASISQMTLNFPPALNTLAKGMAIGGALGLVLMSGRENKNIALRLALGAYDLYNVTGWLSDVLSYSRLLALGLATGVIASVFNQMGSLAGNGVLGAILFTVVFIIGHVFNMAINLLGAYVHTNRLQFVEFFGKFYEGGGRPFHPFKSDTKYVDIKEETN